MIELDIFSDTVCPWCYIGKKRLEKAISNHKDTKFKQTWRPFQLNPGTVSYTHLRAHET